MREVWSDLTSEDEDQKSLFIGCISIFAYVAQTLLQDLQLLSKKSFLLYF